AGLRDDLVTAVQTCALPISRAPAPAARVPRHGGAAREGHVGPARRRDRRLRLSRHGRGEDRRAAGPRCRRGAVLDELRGLAPGGRAALDGAVHSRGHAPVCAILGRATLTSTPTILYYGLYPGRISGMGVQKITVHIDRQLLQRARRRTGQGLTATIRHGLELVAASEVYDRLRALRGKVKFSID